MNRKSLYFALPLIALALMSCQLLNVSVSRSTLVGSGNLKTETRQVSNIERVALEQKGDLTIIQGSTESLKVEADDNLLPYIETKMIGRELKLKIKDTYDVSGSSTIRYTLTVKNLDRITVAGAGNVTAEKLTGGDLGMNVSGSGNIKIADLQGSALRIDTSGTGNFDLKGKVKTQVITINGAGNYTAGDLQSSEAEIIINGAGNATLWADDKLKVQINGFGNVNYYGKPTVTQNIAGGGGVKSLGEHK